MKRPLAVFGMTLALAGCLTAPQTADQVRSMANTSPFLKVSTFQVGRSVSAVNSSLAAGANKCLNRVVSSSHYSPGPYGGNTVNIALKYATSMKTSSRGGELVMSQEIIGGALVIGPDQGLGYVVDTAATGSGTKVTIYGGKAPYKSLDAAIARWARGGTLTCPRMPIE